MTPDAGTPPSRSTVGRVFAALLTFGLLLGSPVAVIIGGLSVSPTSCPTPEGSPMCDVSTSTRTLTAIGVLYVLAIGFAFASAMTSRGWRAALYAPASIGFAIASVGLISWAGSSW